MRLLITIILACFSISTFSQNEDRNDTITNVVDSIRLTETMVVGTSPVAKGNVFRYNAIQAANTISVIGEPDVLRHISSFPGVSTGVEGSLGLFVRGGNCSSNGLYYDDVPMYVSSHFLGFISVFPPEMVGYVNFYQGGIPSSKGNLSSALLEVLPKKCYGEKYNGKFYISPYLVGIYNSLPIAKDKATLQISGRMTPIPYFLKKFDLSDANMDIYDINAKLDVRMSSASTLDVMWFKTNDYFKYSDPDGAFLMQCKETLFKIGWNFNMGNNLSLKTSAYYVNTLSRQSQDGNDWHHKTWISTIGMSSALEEYCIKTNLNWTPKSNLRFNYGISYQKQKYNIDNEKLMLDGVTKKVSDHSGYNQIRNKLFSIYGDVGYDLGQTMDLLIGLRGVNQETDNGSFFCTDIHILNHWYLNRDMGFELTYDCAHQFFHALEGMPTGWSMNIMIPSDNDYSAEINKQLYAGLFLRKNIHSVESNITLGAYYRTMRGLLSYMDGKNSFDFNTDTWQQEVDEGRGKSYGLECSLSAKTDRFMSSLSYTLSKTDRTYPNINYGKVFPFKFDRRHILNYEGSYMFVRKEKKNRVIEHTFGCAVSYASGHRITLPLGTYKGFMPPYFDSVNAGVRHPQEYYNHIYDRQQMSGKNELSTKNYFRTDISYTLVNRGRKTTNELAFSIYNVFNVHNPYAIFREDGKWKQISIMPIMPSIRWAISWK